MLGESIHFSKHLEIDRRNITAGNTKFLGILQGVSVLILIRSRAGRVLLGCVFENAGVPPTEVEHRDRNPADTMLSVNLEVLVSR